MLVVKTIKYKKTLLICLCIILGLLFVNGVSTVSVEQFKIAG